MQTRYLYLLRFILFISDLVLVNICFLLAFQISKKYINQDLSAALYTGEVINSSLIWIIAASMVGLYNASSVKNLESIFRGTWRSIVLHGLFFVAFLFFSHSVHFPHIFLVTFYGLLTIGFVLSRFTGTAMDEVLRRHFNVRKPVAVLGMNEGGMRLAAYLDQENHYEFTGFLEHDGYYVDDKGELLPSAVSQLKEAASAGVKEVYVSLTPDRIQEARFLHEEAERQCVRLKFVPDFTSAASPFQINYLGEFPVLSIRKEPLEDVQNRFKKRVFDVVFSGLVILFVLSWLYPILALIIKIQSPGPVLFKQLRGGRNNKPFWCYKFRSMRVNTESDKLQASKGDNRITKIGAFMRKTSLDELPQFFNVFFGDMSVIGPRPHMVNQNEEYRKLIDKYMVRQFLKPGISGWAQVNGYRGETRDPKLMEKRVEHDIWYMENWSAMLDVKIVFLTVINVVKGEENAY